MRVNITEQRGAWVTDYRAKDESTGKMRRWIKRYSNKRAAEAAAKLIEKEHDTGTHTPKGASPTIATAAKDWLDHVKANGRERTTSNQYEQHVRLHILPVLGENLKLSEITRPGVERFKDKLLRNSVSPKMARKILRSLNSIFKEAMRVGLAAHNPVTGVKVEIKKSKPLEIGVDIPRIEEVRLMIDKAPNSFCRTVIILVAFTGMRSEELRALRWTAIDFKHHRITVDQAMTRYQTAKGPKSEAGHRVIPVMSIVINTLREWKLEHGQHPLVFTSKRKGTAIDMTSLLKKGMVPAVVAAGLVVDGKPKYNVKSLRHFYASLCANREEADGFELPLKEMAVRMGHSDPAFTLRTYGHLLPTRDEAADLRKAERRIFG